PLRENRHLLRSSGHTRITSALGKINLKTDPSPRTKDAPSRAAIRIAHPNMSAAFWTPSDIAGADCLRTETSGGLISSRLYGCPVTVGVP
ncbi:hypothetical protein, partial [Streptomyces lavendulae]